MDPEELKNKLIEAIFPLSPPLGDPRILIEKAKERVGEKQYHWLIEYAGAAKKGKSADVVEKGSYLIHISALEKTLRAAVDTLELPTLSELEGVKKTRQFRRPSLLLAYLLAVVFFSIGFIPDKLWWLKIVVILLSFFLVQFLNHKIFSILEKID
jgi:hypothetical protein